MADQDVRLEGIVDTAEQGMEIIRRFTNDPLEAGAIPTGTGNIQNLKQLIKGFEGTVSTVLKALLYGDAARFPAENGEEVASGENGLLYLPNTNNLFKTAANYDTPVMVAAGTLAVAVSVPHNVYAGINRKAVVLGVMNGTTSSGDLRVEYIPRGSSAEVTGNKHRFRVTLWQYMHGLDKKAQALSAVLPENFQRGVIFARLVAGNLQVDVVDLAAPTTLITGAPVPLPVGWVGISRLAKNLCLGGTDADLFPQTYTSLFGRQNIALWKGEIGFIGLTETSLSDAECLSVAAGADLNTVAGAANVRLYCALADKGLLSLRVLSNRAGVVDALVALGKVLPGSTLRRQSSAQYITLDALKDGVFAPVMQGQHGSEIQLSGSFAGVSGYIEAQVLDSSGAVVKNWTRLCPVPAAGSTWGAGLSLPLHVNALHISVRVTSAPAMVARSNTELFCGYAVLFQAQSQVVFGTMQNATTTGGAALLGIEPKGWGGTVLFASHGGTQPFPAVYRAELCPGFVGAGFVTIANYLRERCPYPLLLVRLAVAGTSLSDLINDDNATRQWALDKAVFSLMVKANKAGQFPYTAQVMNWGSTDVYDDYYQQVLTPYLLGRGSVQVPKASIDHWLYDGVDFDPRMKFVVVPFSRNTGVAGTYDADGSVSAVRRKSMRDGAAQLGYLLGPESTVYSIEGTTDSGTHPNPTQLDGIPLYARSLAEAAAIGCGFGEWKGPTTVSAATVKFTDAGRTAFDVGFGGPLGGGLYTLEGVASVTSFEVSVDSGVTWSKSGFIAAIVDGMACQITKDSGAFPSGTTRVRCYPGSPGHYGIGYFPTWIAGALFKDGFPVSGGNDAYVVAAP